MGKGEKRVLNALRVLINNRMLQHLFVYGRGDHVLDESALYRSPWYLYRVLPPLFERVCGR